MHSRITGRLAAVAVGSLLITGLGAPGAGAATPRPDSVVKGHGSWVEQAYEVSDGGADLTPSQDDVAGPQRAPFGTGSHRITIGQSTVQTELYRTPAHDGQLLSELTRLEYSTLARRTGGSGDVRQPTYLRLSVDNDGDHVRDASLFFFPANNADQQAVANGTWQNWDVTGGRINVDGDDGPAAAISLATYSAAHPGSALVNNNGGSPDGGALALINGGTAGGNTDPQTNGEYFVDRVVVGDDGQDTLYDLGNDAETTGATSHVTVDPANAHGWVHQAYDNDNDLTSNQSFVDGPATPPAGGGSLRFTLSNDTNPDRIELFRTPTYDHTLVRDLRDIEFNTFQRATGGNTTPQQPVYLRLNLDDDGDGTRDTSLYYLPANNGAVSQGAWQQWSIAQDTGKWSVNGDSGPAETVTLADYAVAHPDAVVVNNNDGAANGGGVAFIVGGGGAGQINGEYFLDDITISKVDAATGATSTGTEFDLEPTLPSVSIGDASVSEGNRGATLRFPVTLSRPVARPVTINFATANDTARAGSDYRATSGTLTIPAGATSGEVTVPVVSDMVRERTETMTVSLTSPQATTIADGTATGTITDNDTLVSLGLAQATKHRVRVTVDTLPDAPGAPVKVYRVLQSRNQRVLSANLSSTGRITRVLATEFKPGTKVTYYAVVRTDEGLYTSRTKTITVRR